MSSNFLQRFKGKTQAISKDGVHNILGGFVQSANNTNKPNIFSHTNGLNSKQKYNSTQSQNMNSLKNMTQQITKKPSSQNKMAKTNTNLKQPKLPLQNQHKQLLKKPELQQKPKNTDNPFLISNPFYLDEQQKNKSQAQQIELLKLKKHQQQKKKRQQQKKKLQENKKYPLDSKKTTYSTSMNPSNDSSNKKTQKEWAKLGGLGPNIGGNQWQQKKKKLQKMQEFANQVKANNSKKEPPIQKIVDKNDQKKDDPRSKALQYSKKVPKPVIRSYQKQYKQEESLKTQEKDIQQMSELQIYQKRHKQLQQILKNQL